MLVWCDKQFKVSIFGDQEVGKSNILTKFTNNSFVDQHEPTIGVEFGVKVISIGEEKVKLPIWDTGGSQNFRSIALPYARGAKICLFVYDITNKGSFESIKNFWYKKVAERIESNTTCVLVGNKSDLGEDRKVTSEDAKSFAEANGMLFQEVSARTGENIEKAFTDAAVEALKLDEKAKTNTNTKTNTDTSTSANKKIITQYCDNDGSLRMACYFHLVRFFRGEKAVEDEIKSRAEIEQSKNKTYRASYKTAISRKLVSIHAEDSDKKESAQGSNPRNQM